MATAEYYAARPADPAHINQQIVTLADKIISDLLSGAVTSSILKVFVQKFGPAGVAEFLSKEITREGDFIFIDGERFIADISFKAAMVEFIATGVTAALGTVVAQPLAYIVGAIAGAA